MLPHNYCILSPRGYPYACLADKAIIERGWNALPPQESYATIGEAIDRLPVLFAEVARLTFPERMPIPEGSISVKVVLLDTVLAGRTPSKSVGKRRIIQEFRKHPSVPIVGLVKFWESDWEQITCLLQGQQEVQAWLQSPEAQELSGIVRSIGATAATVSGIEVT